MIISELWAYFRIVFPYYLCPIKTWDNPMTRTSRHMDPLFHLLPDNKKEREKGRKRIEKIIPQIK